MDSGGGQSVVSIIVICFFGGCTEYKKNKWKTGNHGSTCHRMEQREAPVCLLELKLPIDVTDAKCNVTPYSSLVFNFF